MPAIFFAVQTLLAAYAAYSQVQATKDAAEYNAAVAKNNETLAKYQQQAEAEKGVQDELDLRRETARMKGSQITQMAAAGLDLSEGSATDILAGTDYMGEVDALRVRDQSKRNQWAIGERVKGYAGEAAMQSSVASSQSPLLAAVGTGFVGAPKAAQAYKERGGWL